MSPQPCANQVSGRPIGTREMLMRIILISPETDMVVIANP
jgi:hypothetical protein